jgi:tetratricopeptide (TPR) repeat protein
MGAHLQTAYELYAATLGEDDPKTLVSLFWCAYRLAMQGEHVEANPLYARAVTGLARVCGSEDRRTLNGATWQATSLYQVGNYEQSEAILLDAIETARRAFGAEDPITLTAMGQYAYLLHRMGRDREHERFVSEVLQICRQSRPDDHMRIARLAWSLGKSLEAQERKAEAVTYFQEAYDRYHLDGAGVIHPAITCTYDLTKTLTFLGEADKAETLGRDKLNDCLRELGADHEYTLWARWVLAEHLRLQGRPGEALKVLGEAHDRAVRVLGPDRYYVVFATMFLARIHRDLGNLEKSLSLFRQAYEVHHRDRPDGADALRVRADLANLLQFQLDRADEAQAASSRGVGRPARGPRRELPVGTHHTLSPGHDPPSRRGI